MLPYNLRRDWPDEESELILKNVRKAMKPGSRVIIRALLITSAHHQPLGPKFAIP